eukprot:TRINITY_DN1057_c3_g2_i1.p1 TRINITY_DN1057_c3_g2~~TRINITY_DN1057_c3_g2_i1.p1  ORF type:complete len:360 (+),score=127.95 TRINITY_DN1057_c3_g2_i1:105-1184(+)
MSEEISWKGKCKKFDTKEDVSEIVDALNNGENIKKVILGGNTYSVEAVESIAEALKGLDQIEVLDCNDMFTTRKKDSVPVAIGLMKDAIEDKANFREMDLSDNAVGAPGTKAVIDLLERNNFKNLNLNNCGIGPSGVQVISDKVNNEACENIGLSCLKVGRNRLQEEGGIILGTLLGKLENLEEFHVHGNSIKPKGMVAICESMKNLKKLKILNFNDNSFKEEGTDALVALLPSLSDTLEHLDLGDCLLDNEGCVKIINELSKHDFTNLKHLDLSYNEMESETAVLLANFIENKSNLLNLELNGNLINNDSFEAIKSKIISLGFDPEEVIGDMSDNEFEEFDEEDDINDLIDQTDNISI